MNYDLFIHANNGLKKTEVALQARYYLCGLFIKLRSYTNERDRTHPALLLLLRLLFKRFALVLRTI